MAFIPMETRMKYVIKEGSQSYLQAENYHVVRSSNFVYDIGNATKFDTIREALDVIRLRDRIYYHNISPQASFTIVGIKEVNTPRYEEVAL